MFYWRKTSACVFGEAQQLPDRNVSEYELVYHSKLVGANPKRCF